MTDEMRDLKIRLKHWRAINKDVFQKVEIKQMGILNDLYRQYISDSVPQALRIITEKKSFAIEYDVVKAERHVLKDRDFEFQFWIGFMRDKDGPFKIDAELIVKKLCQYEKAKAERHISEGFVTSPEILFCLEIQDWASQTLALMEPTKENKVQITRRIRYLEEVIARQDLFQPLRLVKDIIHQYILGVRHILKYRVIPTIDKELAHQDATKSLSSMKKHLVSLLKDSLEFLMHVFKETYDNSYDIDTLINTAITVPDRYTEILKLLARSPNILSIFSPRSVIRENLIEPQWSNVNRQVALSVLDPPPTGFLHVENGEIQIAQKLLPMDPNSKTTFADPFTLIQLKDRDYARFFCGQGAGVEEGFRGKQPVLNFLNCVALVKELGDLHDVLQKAEYCSKQGGTLLVYGVANTQLNATLSSFDMLLNGLRRYINNLCVIAEARYEALVFKNAARSEKHPWILNYRTLHSIIEKIENIILDLGAEITEMRAQANSMTLYEQFQKAQENTARFLKDAEDFSMRAAKVLGVQYVKPPNHTVVKLPDLSTIEYLMSTEKGTTTTSTTTSTTNHTAFRSASVQDEDSLGEGSVVDLSRALTTIHRNECLNVSNIKSEKITDPSDEAFEAYESKEDGKFKPKGEGNSQLRGTTPRAHWYYKEGNNNASWKPYSDDVSQKLEQQWSIPPKNTKEKEIVEYKDMKFDIRNYLEIKSLSKREITRGTWFWQENDKSWVPYDHEVSDVLESAATKYEKFQIKISEKPARIVVGFFGSFRQFRKSTNALPEGRDVQRGYQGDIF